LFPLNTVLFPGLVLPLRIFEQRYRLLVRDVVQAGQVFGVTLIKEGSEVGAPAVPHLIGTTARTVQVSPEAEDGFHIITIGVQPFRIRHLQREQPYIEAEVEYLDSVWGDPDELVPLAATVRDSHRRYLALICELAGRPFREVPDELDAEALSYMVAGTLQVDLMEQQHLLEERNTARRLEVESALLERECRLIKDLIARDR
jgi:Lon protease-like protein